MCAAYRRESRHAGLGILAGVAGGLAGSVVLEAFIALARRKEVAAGASSLDPGGPAHQVADLAVRKATDRSLSAHGRITGGRVVHYLFGAVVGGFYGGLGEYYDWVRLGSGALFGAGVFLCSDELSMPALGLVPKPTEEPASAQLAHAAAHLAFGVSTELVRSLIRRSL